MHLFKSSMLTLGCLLLGSNVALAGEVYHQSYHSKQLERPFSYNIYLPDGYNKNSETKYPVIYALHGSGGDEYNWLRKGRKFGGDTHIKSVLDKLISTSKLQPSIVIFPGAYQSWWVDGNKEPIMTALMEEFIPQVEKEWHGIGSKSGRALVGLSMGAYGSLNLAVRYPEKFAAAALLSPSVFSKEGDIPANNNASKQDAFAGNGKLDKALYGENHYSHFIEDYKAANSPVALYIVSGDSDKYGVLDVAYTLYKTFKPLQPKLTALQVQPETNHEWKAWNNTIENALIYMAYYLDYPGDGSTRGVDAYNQKVHPSVNN